jgi:hypothetical protein
MEDSRQRCFLPSANDIPWDLKPRMIPVLTVPPYRYRRETYVTGETVRLVIGFNGSEAGNTHETSPTV